MPPLHYKRPWVHYIICGPCGARGCCTISPPRFLAECRKRRLNRGSFVSAVCLVVYFLWFVLCLCVYFCDLYSVCFLIVCLSVTVKWLAVKTAPKMTYTVSSGALNSAQSSFRCQIPFLLPNQQHQKHWKHCMSSYIFTFCALIHRASKCHYVNCYSFSWSVSKTWTCCGFWTNGL